jgi:hypothetical protein
MIVDFYREAINNMSQMVHAEANLRVIATRNDQRGLANARQQ